MNFLENGTSFKLKEIMPTFEDFQTDVNNYNYMSKYIIFTEENSQILYYMLMTNYANAYIRQQTPYLFYSDFINIYLSNYRKYFKLLNAIAKVYEDYVDLTVDETEKTTETTSNNSSTSSNSKTADTPTVVNPATEFDADYTSMASSANANGEFKEDKSFTRTKDYNIVDSIENALKLTGFPLKEMAQDFAPLFIQIDNPTKEYLYFD